MEYKLELKQIVDYPRCRMYRQFILNLIGNKNLRVNGNSHLYYYTVLCCYANFRTSYHRVKCVTYTLYPGEWICKFDEIMKNMGNIEIPAPTVIEIPVLYGGEMGPDIETVASHNGKTVEEVIKIHTSEEYLIYNSCEEFAGLAKQLREKIKKQNDKKKKKN